jgi:hypothetical protein
LFFSAKGGFATKMRNVSPTWVDSKSKYSASSKPFMAIGVFGIVRSLQLGCVGVRILRGSFRKRQSDNKEADLLK